MAKLTILVVLIVVASTICLAISTTTTTTTTLGNIKSTTQLPIAADHKPPAGPDPVGLNLLEDQAAGSALRPQHRQADDQQSHPSESATLEADLETAGSAYRGYYRPAYAGGGRGFYPGYGQGYWPGGGSYGQGYYPGYGQGYPGFGGGYWNIGFGFPRRPYVG